MVAAGDAATLLSALEGACTSCRPESPVNRGEGNRLRAKVIQTQKVGGDTRERVYSCMEWQHTYTEIKTNTCG